MRKMKWSKALVKASLIASACFVMSIILFSAGAAIDGALISPKQNLLVLAMSAAVGVVSFFRIMIDRSRWAMERPHIIKNFLFAPLYLAVAVVFIWQIFGQMDIALLIYISAVFMVTFLIGQTILYFVSKKDTDRMNDALKDFQKEHEWNEQE